MSKEWKEPLLPWMIEALQSQGFEEATAVQAATIPLMSANKDVVVQAVTGSGKTLAFVLPILVRLGRLDKLLSGETNAIILSPTRELAQQTHKVLKGMIDLSPDPTKIRCQLVTGGNNSSNIGDLKTYLNRRPHVVVATPGRLLELLGNKHVHTRAVDMLVLDEADRLLDTSADQTLHKIISLLPKQKRVALFSATIDDAVQHIVLTGMRNPLKINVKNQKASTPDQLQIKYIELNEPAERIPKLVSLVGGYQKTIIYAATCQSVTHWYHVLSLFLDCKLFSMHGKLPQTTRIKTLDKFSECIDKCILITTDVAARGLDIPDINLVVQLDPPNDPDVFVHRSGRTARAGNSGTAVVFLNNDLEKGYVDFMRVRRVFLEPLDNVEAKDPEATLARMQQYTRSDRANHDLALKAFLSFVRFYSKHTMASIFRIQNVDLVGLAKAYGILRVPRMPELKGVEIANNGFLVDEFDFDSFGYKDPQQEKARLAALAELKGGTKGASKSRKRDTEAWSRQTERKTEAQTRRDKRLKRGIAKKEAQPEASDDEQDWKDLVKEKKKAASKQVFDL